MGQAAGLEPTSNTNCIICMDQFNLLYTCSNTLCEALYCHVCIEQWLCTDSCPKVCALCKSSTVLTIAHNTTSVPADLTITLTRVENATLNISEGIIEPAPPRLFQPTSHPMVIAVHLIVHFLIHVVFICHLYTKQVIPKQWNTVLVIYYVLMGLHLLWLVAIRTQYCQRRYRLALLAMAIPVCLMLYRLGIGTAVLPVSEVPMISVLSTLAGIIDIATCWTF
jgi:hypothetical protein